MTTDRQRAYQRRNLALLAVLLPIWGGVSFAAAAGFGPLEQVRVAGVPLGFWLGQQGVVLVFVALVGLYVVRLNALDRALDLHE